MKPKIMAACNITQPGDPKVVRRVYFESAFDKVEEKCTEAKADSENHEEGNGRTGTIDTVDMTELKLVRQNQHD